MNTVIKKENISTWDVIGDISPNAHALHCIKDELPDVTDYSESIDTRKSVDLELKPETLLKKLPGKFELNDLQLQSYLHEEIFIKDETTSESATENTTNQDDIDNKLEDSILGQELNGNVVIKNEMFSDTKRKHTKTSLPRKNIWDDMKALNSQVKKVFNCEECNKSFPTYFSQIAHMRLHTGETPFECQICKRKFRIKSSLTGHMATHEGAKAFKCEICKKGFSCKKGLTNHMKQHTKSLKHVVEQLFTCHICESEFPENSLLKCHMLIHSNEQFKINQSLGRHQKSRISSEVFPCDLCNNQYTLKGSLKRHMRNHTGGRPYQCNICSKSFTVESVLNHHLATHAKEKPFPCPICKRKFAQFRYLQCHLKTHTVKE